MDPTQEERTVQELSEAFIALIGDGRSDTGVRALVFTALRYILGGAETPAQAEELLFDTFSVMTVLYTEMLSARFPSDDASQPRAAAARPDADVSRSERAHRSLSSCLRRSAGQDGR